MKLWFAYRFNNRYHGPHFSLLYGPYPTKEAAEKCPSYTLSDTERLLPYEIDVSADGTFKFGGKLISITGVPEGTLLDKDESD